MTAAHPAGLDLAAIEGRHVRDESAFGPVCGECWVRWPCETGALLTEVRALRAMTTAAREWRDAENAVTALQQRHGSLRNYGPAWERYTAARDRAAVLLEMPGEDTERGIQASGEQS